MAINKKKSLTRFSILKGIVAGLFTVIILRVTYLQVFRYEDFKEKADTRSMRFMAEKAPRGKIYDANGNVLATNKQTYIATFTETDDSKEAFYRTMETFFDLMDESEQEITDKLDIMVNEKNEVYFDFGFETESNNKAAELRFKRDKGILDEIQKVEFPKVNTDLTDEQIEIIEAKALEVRVKDVFSYLVYKYEMVELLSEYKDRDTHLDEDADYALRKSVKDRYKASKETFSEKIIQGEKVLEALLKENSLNDIRRFMAIKDAMKMQSFSGFKPVTIAPTLTQDAAFVVYQKLNSLIGIDISLEPVRYYPYGEMGASFLGYMGAIPGASKDKYESRGYDLSTDLMGVAGVESAYENVLKGTKGGDMVKVNAAGRRRESLYSMQTTPGNNVHLTIDKDIQYSAETMMKDQLEHLRTKENLVGATRGAAVAMDIKTGDILAMVSYPGFDPNIFASGKVEGDVAEKLLAPDLEAFGNEYVRKTGIAKSVDELFPKDENGLRQDPNDIYPKPMYNYATIGLIPPGSTFKPITALVALEEGVMNASSTVSDGAVLSGLRFVKYADLIGTPLDNNHHGTVTVKEAIQKSCNSYFYETAVRLYRKYNSSVEGLDSIAKYSSELGLAPNSLDKDVKKGTGIEIAERIGSVYNFDGSKEKFKTFSMWDLVGGLEKGRLNGNGQTFRPVDIERNEEDSKALKEAKDSLKEIVKTEIDNIDSLSYKGNEKEFRKIVENALQVIYDNSEKYQSAIKKNNSNLKIQFEIISTEIWNWIQFNVKHQIVNPGNLASASIGQGETNVTPLQMVSAIGTLVNGGTRYKVNLVDKITSNTGDVVKDFEPEILNKMDISKNNVDVIKDGMHMTNHKLGGTAYPIFGAQNFPIPTGGKTGTATFKEDQEEYGRQPYGVYASFAPIDDPEIAVFVIGYDAKSGGRMAIVARAIYETYFRDEIKEIAPSYKPRNSVGDEYTYTLNPESMDFKDEGIFYKELPKTEEEIEFEKKEEAKVELDTEILTGGENIEVQENTEIGLEEQLNNETLEP